MSSKRGRKRNDNLPPNRARDVQRAFRARRAAHLEALENRVQELEEENNALRAALNLPPAVRPPLGKGPTGKDKPKSYTSRSPASDSLSAILSTSLPSGAVVPAASGSGSGSPSSASTRTTSMSPISGDQSMVGWDSIHVRKDRPDQRTSPPFAYTPTSAYAYPQSPSSRQQNSMLYAQSGVTAAYQTTNADRNPVDGYFQRYSMGQNSYSTSVHDSQVHNQSPTAALSATTQQHANSIPYPHRRSMTDSQGYRPGVVMNHQGLPTSMPHAQQQQQDQSAHVVRIPSSEGMASVRPSVYDMESRVGRMPT